MSEQWRTSLQVRVIGSILIASTVVMMILGFALASLVTSRLTDGKIEQASNEIDRARIAVEQQITATGSASSVQVRLQSARAALSQLSYQSGESSSVYEPVLVVSSPDGSVTTAPENYRVPEGLQDFVSEGQVSYQFATTTRTDGQTYNALFIGTPTNTDIPGLQLYLVYPMDAEESTVALMQGILAMAGVVVVVLLVAIAWLATQQVTAPVRSASRIAQRLAAGHLRERMVVEGEDEMARLALSFNDMAEKLLQQIKQLEEYGDLQRQFTSDVSHELRTPLTTVRMAADMIADDAEDFEPHTKRATELMMRELDRFEMLLNDLLEISRHDAGVADLSSTRLDVRSPVHAAWEATQHLAEKLNVEVSFDLPAKPVWIVGDSRRIERIMRNLIANAIDHSEGNPVEVAMAADDDAVAITVTDSGIGLKPGQEELVFNRFWRADASRKRHSGGTGLGLAIAREDAELHGGILDATGTEGVGSQFRLVLPRDQEGDEIVAADAPLALETPVDEHEVAGATAADADTADPGPGAGTGFGTVTDTVPDALGEKRSDKGERR
ncbi:MtrAB system histidine kinase MtrB [Corynebacterium guangdongense]|uniref:Sensor histidine kinase MtrB n=1 Tax=Corynebacterium guangdongense TaxID=1783348 RepID=A0ABU1ZXS0_9CORY|nr:MtrAB system histidine kinase MtrB [Corynebacterium guangdongense]MDR7328698.1 two-component system sensor histidine kinase MtrB [Corynebacterium guangdongense]WJZ17275.1 Sensor histidine kinase MtrB [Corynebacterium guangdongense]